MASSRRELIELADTRRPITNAQEVSFPFTIRRPSDAEFFVAWDRDPSNDHQFPCAIFIPEREQREFLAWTATFLEFFRPFTSYCRVIDPMVLDATGLGGMRTIPRLAQLPLLGLILGEVLGETEARGDLRSLFPIACYSTFSFVVARALCLRMPASMIASLPKRWESALRLTRQSRRRLSLGSLEEVWSTASRAAPELFPPLFQARSGNAAVAEACTELLHINDISLSTWRRVTNGVSEYERIKSAMNGSREDRVLACERALASLEQMGFLEGIPRDFIAGFLMSRISPGTLDHVGLLREYIVEFPAATLWYGFCAGCQLNGDLLNAGAGLGRRVLRDVTREEGFFSRPESDIAIAELDVLANDGGPTVSFRQERSGYLNLELLPGVRVQLRSPDVDEEDDKDVSDVIRELDEVTWRLHEVRRRLITGTAPSDAQDRPLKRGRKKRS